MSDSFEELAAKTLSPALKVLVEQMLRADSDTVRAQCAKSLLELFSGQGEPARPQAWSDDLLAKARGTIVSVLDGKGGRNAVARLSAARMIMSQEFLESLPDEALLAEVRRRTAMRGPEEEQAKLSDPPWECAERCSGSCGIRGSQAAISEAIEGHERESKP